MWLPKTDNPYCDVSTYTCAMWPSRRCRCSIPTAVVIVVNGRIWSINRPMAGLMAHECCHRTLGHVDRYEGFGHVGPQPFFYIAPALKQMELDADCCAVRMLKFRHETDSIEAAEAAMVSFGASPTGAYYPTGDERADNIAKCAAED